MSKIISAVRKFIADEEGVTALEYGLMAALIAAAIAGTVGDLGQGLKTTFNDVLTSLGVAAV